MKPSIPLGDLLRALVPTNWKWVRLALEMVKGIMIRTDKVDIQLDEGHGATPPRTAGLDAAPHEPGPPTIGSRH